MKTLQHPEQPAQAAVSPGPEMAPASPPPAAPAPAPALSPDSFSAGELAAAEQLLVLSDGSTSTGGLGGGASSSSAASGSSSPRSVNAAPAPALPAAPRGPGARGDTDEDEDDQEVAGSQRRTKRYRPIAEIYRATERINRCSPGKKKE